MTSSLMNDALRDRVLDKLGFDALPATDVDGLHAVYAAWCERVPFDNVRKMIALRTPGAALPGTTADDFFDAWLRDGAGGTCWPSSLALWALLCAAGFEARRVVASMRDTGQGSHGTVKVRAGGRDWLVDSSMLTQRPVPCGNGTHVDKHAVWPVEIEAVDGSHLVWFDGTPSADPVTCRILQDPAQAGWYESAYEASRERSPFNHRLYARRNFPGEVRLFVGAARFSKTAAGVETRALSREGLVTALCEELGFSERVVAEWVRSGALDSSLEPPAGPKPPPPAGVRPSMRGVSGQG